MFHQTIIAEIGSVHDGSFGNALKLVELAAHCGAGIVKFQTHIAEAETLADAPSPPYFSGEPRMDYFRRTAFSPEQWRQLATHCTTFKVSFLSSPFSIEAVDLLEDIGVAGYKIPSGEVSNLPLIERVAEAGKPVLLSSGMSSWDELDRAVDVLAKVPELVVMQCSSVYPCSPQRVGLNVLAEMQTRYKCAIGFSDHTNGSAAPIAAAAMGATSIEKHLTFSKAMYGSDAANAMEPPEFTRLCDALRDVWLMLDHPVDKNDVSAFADMKKIFEKSVVTARPLPSGTRITWEDLAFKKPGDGFPAWRYREVLGRTTRTALNADQQILERDLI